MSRALAAYCIWVSLAVGGVVLGLEVLAARTMAPALGTGSVAWASLLAVALGSLAAGNLVGGLISQGRPVLRVLVWLLLVASLFLILLAGSFVGLMAWAAGLAAPWGSLAGAGATQTLPMFLLGCVTPGLIQCGGGRPPGRWAGLVLAGGSLGGIMGALSMGLWLLPVLGIGSAYLCLALLLVVTAVPGAIAGRQWAAGAVAVLNLVSALLLFKSSDSSGVTQSRYGQIEVKHIGSTRVLLIDGLPQTGTPESPEAWDGLGQGYLLETALLFRPGLRHALVVGLGAGLAPRLLARHGLECESVEIDPEVVRIARAEFGFDGSVTVKDGRRHIREANRRWDLIVLDVCTSDRLPLQLFTVECFELVRRRLNPGGVLALQFIGDDAGWSASVLRTVERVFGSSLMLAPPEPPWQEVGPRWILVGVPAGAEAAWEAGFPGRVIRPAAAGFLLTDAHFPSERAWSHTALKWRRAHAGVFQ